MGIKPISFLVANLVAKLIAQLHVKPILFLIENLVRNLVNLS